MKGKTPLRLPGQNQYEQFLFILEELGCLCPHPVKLARSTNKNTTIKHYNYNLFHETIAFLIYFISIAIISKLFFRVIEYFPMKPSPS